MPVGTVSHNVWVLLSTSEGHHVLWVVLRQLSTFTNSPECNHSRTVLDPYALATRFVIGLYNLELSFFEARSLGLSSAINNLGSISMTVENESLAFGNSSEAPSVRNIVQGLVRKDVYLGFSGSAQDLSVLSTSLSQNQVFYRPSKTTEI